MVIGRTNLLTLDGPGDGVVGHASYVHRHKETRDHVIRCDNEGGFREEVLGLFLDGVCWGALLDPCSQAILQDISNLVSDAHCAGACIRKDQGGGLECREYAGGRGQRGGDVPDDEELGGCKAVGSSDGFVMDPFKGGMIERGYP